MGNFKILHLIRCVPAAEGFERVTEQMHFAIQSNVSNANGRCGGFKKELKDFEIYVMKMRLMASMCQNKTKLLCWLMDWISFFSINASRSSFEKFLNLPSFSLFWLSNRKHPLAAQLKNLWKHFVNMSAWLLYAHEHMNSIKTTHTLRCNCILITIRIFSLLALSFSLIIIMWGRLWRSLLNNVLK